MLFSQLATQDPRAVLRKTFEIPPRGRVLMGTDYDDAIGPALLFIATEQVVFIRLERNQSFKTS